MNHSNGGTNQGYGLQQLHSLLKSNEQLLE